MIQFISKHERKLFAVLCFVIITFGIFQMIRPDHTSAIVSGIDSASYTRGNHVLWVYVSSKEFDLRSSPDFRRNADNKAGTLRRGSLFFVSEESQGVQTVTGRNYPRDNITKYQFKRIEVFDGLERSSRFALVSSSMLLGEEVIREIGGIESNSLPFIDWIVSELRSNGWNGKDAFSYGHFGYLGDGLYYSELLSPSPFYNRKGRKLGTLEAGTKVLFSYNLPPAVGHKDPTKIRTVGYMRKDSNTAIVGTFFVDLLRNGNILIATMTEQ